MRYVTDRLVLYAFLFYGMFIMKDGGSMPYAFYIFVFLCSVVAYLMYDEKNFLFRLGAYIALLSMTACIFDSCVYILPFAIYDSVRGKIKLSYPVAGAFLLSVVFRGYYYEGLLCGLAILLSIRTLRFEALSRDYKRLRDDGEEKRRTLEEANRKLQTSGDELVYMAQLSERNRIAREIHDNVGHVLSRSLLHVGALMTVHKNDKVYDELTPLRENLDDAMNSIRKSVHSIYDESIDLRFSMKEAIRPLINGDYELDYSFDVSDDVPRHIKLALIAITKECVNNIIKHSHNKRVDVKLTEHPAMYQLSIHDYGEKSAERVEEVETEGIGLDSIRKRVEELHGNLVISRDNGFRVFLTIKKEAGN